MVVEKVLWNYKGENYKEVIANLLKKYHAMYVIMPHKIHCLHLHPDFSIENLEAVSDEHAPVFTKILTFSK